MKFTQTTLLGLALLVCGLALCGAGAFLLSRPAQYQATARIRVIDRIKYENTATNSNEAFDPYFIQTAFEVMQSQIVLSNAISALNLQEIWGNKFAGGKKLRLSEAMLMLRQRLVLTPVRGTQSQLIDITFNSDDPNEAANVANAMADACRQYRRQTNPPDVAPGIKAMLQEYQVQEDQLQTMQANLNLLRAQLKVSDADWTNPPAEPQASQAELQGASPQKPYWDEKKLWDQLEKVHKQLYLKIDREKVDDMSGPWIPVQVVDPAVPPQFPLLRHFALGVSLFVVGLFPTVVGVWLLRTLRREFRQN